MRLKDVWATMVRRWYLALLALGLAVAGTLYVIARVGPTYESEGSVLVFPPVATVQRETELQAQGNPYLVLNGVSQARDIVIRSLSSKSTLDDLATEHPDSTFEVTPDFTNSAPIILITAKAGSAADATAAVTAMMGRVPPILADLQSGLDLPTQAQITSRPLFADPEPDRVYSSQIRAGIVAAVVALTLGLLLVALLDGLLTGRANRKADAGPDDSLTPEAPRRRAAPLLDARGQERSRRMGPRAPVRSNGDDLSSKDDRPDAMDQSQDRRLRSVAIRADDSRTAARAAKA